MLEIQIRAIREADASQRSDVIREAFEKGYCHLYSKEQIRDLFSGTIDERSAWVGKRQECLSTLLAISDHQIVGTMSVVMWNETEAELSSLYVRPEFQNKNIGRRLWDACITLVQQKKFKTLFVYTLENGPAVSFYQKMGCVNCDRSKYDVGGHVEHVVALSKSLI